MYFRHQMPPQDCWSDDPGEEKLDASHLQAEWEVHSAGDDEEEPVWQASQAWQACRASQASQAWQASQAEVAAALEPDSLGASACSLQPPLMLPDSHDRLDDSQYSLDDSSCRRYAVSRLHDAALLPVSISTDASSSLQ